MFGDREPLNDPEKRRGKRRVITTKKNKTKKLSWVNRNMDKGVDKRENELIDR